MRRRNVAPPRPTHLSPPDLSYLLGVKQVIQRFCEQFFDISNYNHNALKNGLLLFSILVCLWLFVQIQLRPAGKLKRR